MHGALAFPHVILHVSFIELAVAEEDLHISVLHVPAIEATFKDLVRCVEQNTLALGATLAPLTFVNRSTAHELANARAMSQIILPVTFEDVAIGHYHMTLTVLEAL